MRLLEIKDDGGIQLSSYWHGNIPPYAILSHTWREDGNEVTFQDVVSGKAARKLGYVKIDFCRRRARLDGLAFFWVDTCCIDKSSSAELSEAFNSMFKWYRDAAKCYVYLSDITFHGSQGSNYGLPWQQSRWFTRSWTLQELIAPPSVEFFSQDGERLGDKNSSKILLRSRTGIPLQALQGAPLSQFTVAERLSWAKGRESVRGEDKAYSLLGIFDVFMPLVYGEGEQHAFKRLHEEIRRRDVGIPGELSQSTPTLIKSTGQAEAALNAVSSRIVPFGRISRSTSGDHGLSRPEEETFTEETLRYDPLADFEFRIFVLEPGAAGSNIVGHIEKFNLFDPPAYYALSYFWGQEPAIHQAFINEQVKVIQPNLFYALQRVRLRRGQLHIWVDALCINQLDPSERNMQVRQMAKIYSKASSVLVWLGEEDSTSKTGLECVTQIISTNFHWDGSWWERYEFNALAQILERPWFRRGWVLQEAAFSSDSIIRCGDREVHMDHLIRAIDFVRARLSTVQPSQSRTANTLRTVAMAKFYDSPALRLLDTIEDAFTRSTDGEILHHNMSLETLVDLSTFSETSDLRDAIYTLLNLANDTASFSRPDQCDTIIPDYEKDVLDVFVDFILHCCDRAASLDIICRPWAPVPSQAVYSSNQDDRAGHNLPTYPSWITSRDMLPFGNPSLRLQRRLHGKPLVGGSQRRVYNAHYGTSPYVSVGRNKDGTCNGSLQARGILLGWVARRSTRLADAIITQECLEILGNISRNPHSSLINVPDTIWRTLCANRDGQGEQAPRFYRAAMLDVLKISLETSHLVDSIPLLDRMCSIDIEELLDTEVADHVKNFLTVVRDVIWNRRTFRSSIRDGTDTPLVGLIPQHARVGDQICILYGCSVPVALRRLPGTDGTSYRLIGDAYVHGNMEGEAIRSASSGTQDFQEQDFEIR